MSLHINPLNVTHNGEGAVVAPEAMVLYPENSVVFQVILKAVGDWEYYISETVELDATAFVTVKVGEIVEEAESQCSAYIYGYMPGSQDWMEGSCVAIVFFAVPKLAVSALPSSVTIMVRVETDGAIIFNSKRTIPIYGIEESKVEDTL